MTPGQHRRAQLTWPVPKVGDRVRLTDQGLEICFGSKFGLSHMKSKVMRVVEVGTESLTSPEETIPVDVDDPDIGMLLTDNWCFEIVKD